MGGIGFKFVMFRFYGSEKVTLRISLSSYKKGNVPLWPKLRW